MGTIQEQIVFLNTSSVDPGEFYTRRNDRLFYSLLSYKHYIINQFKWYWQLPIQVSLTLSLISTSRYFSGLASLRGYSQLRHGYFLLSPTISDALKLLVQSCSLSQLPFENPVTAENLGKFLDYETAVQQTVKQKYSSPKFFYFIELPSCRKLISSYSLSHSLLITPHVHNFIIILDSVFLPSSMKLKWIHLPNMATLYILVIYC